MKLTSLGTGSTVAENGGGARWRLLVVFGSLAAAGLACGNSSTIPANETNGGGSSGGADAGSISGSGGSSDGGGTGSAAVGGGGGTGGAGSSSGSGGAGAPTGVGGSNGVGGASPWVELTQPTLTVQGGTALSAGGQGQPGGVVHFVASGDTDFDPAQPAVAAPSVPATPAGATEIVASALAADATVSGDAVLDGSVATGGTDTVRKITVGGNLYLTGTLRTADLGSARQGIDLEVSGTLYLTGALDASGASGAGQEGGTIHVSANQIVVTGRLSSAGGDGPSTGGAAGAVSMAATQAIVITGTVDASGGNAAGAGPISGGAAAGLTLQAGGTVGVAGTVHLRGGAATASGAGSAQGGAAAALTINANGAVTLAGIIDGRGGPAVAAAPGGAVAGGAAGAVHVGETAPPPTISLLVPLVASGGDGIAAAGAGGTVTPEPGTGDVNIAGPMAIDLRGGNSMSAPGTGGLLTGSGRTDPGTGSVHVTGEIDASGGSIMVGGSGNGADGGRVQMELIPTDGAVMIDTTAMITVEGGASGGMGTAGGGGHVWFWTKDGDATIAGTVSVRGGDAPDPGGIGGEGGMIYFFTDNNNNAVQVCKGNLLVATTGMLDASGGDGATGGSGRNDGVQGLVASFPDHQEEISIFLNCDGEHGNTCNWMENDGVLVANGGVHNGNGGDIVYHGIPPGVLGTPSPDSGDYPVPSGNISNKGDGTGLPGDFDGE
ncbi:MAG TPA: hypothetical protein VLC06_18480 [Polyangia bacterium]|nr:hypothetical protein [Polyangia bacterium]